jgi:hypothetical protein
MGELSGNPFFPLLEEVIMLRALFGFGRKNRFPQRPAPKAVRPRSWQPLLEELESRLTPNCTEKAGLANVVIACKGGGDTVTIERVTTPFAGPKVKVTATGLPTPKQYDCTALASLTANMEPIGAAPNPGGNTINVLGTCSSPVAINQETFGGVGDQVNVGNAVNGIQDILGQLTIENTPDYNTITVHDEADPGAPGAFLDTVGGGTFGRILMGPADIRYEYADTKSITINTSKVNGNFVNVQSTGVPTTLNGNGTVADLTTVYVGNAVNGMQDIRGTLNINNVPSYTQLFLDDSADPFGGQHAILSANNVSGRVHGLAPADIVYETAFADVKNLTIYGSNSGSNTFCVLSTYANTPVTIFTGWFGDTINIGNSVNGLSDIHSTVNLVDAFAFADTINFNNVGGPNDNYVAAANNVTDTTLAFTIVNFSQPPWLMQYWGNGAWAGVIPGFGPPPC